MTPPSLQGRLLVGTGIAAGLALLAAGAALHALVERSLVAESDRALLARARLIASAVEQDRRGRWDLEELDELDFPDLRATSGDDPEPRSFLQLWGPDGAPLHRSASLGDDFQLSPPTGDDARGWFALPASGRARFVTLTFEPRREERSRAGDAAAGVRLALTLARDARELDGVLATLRGLLLLVGSATLLATGAGLAWAVRRSLRPLDRVADRLAAIGPDDLAARLDPAGVPAELLPVVARVNEMLGRLEAAFERERAFAADVAHELRTPLAGLRATLEVAGARDRAAEDYAAALRSSGEQVERLQAMVERLLQLARLDADLVPCAEVPVDLADLLLDAWEPLAHAAQARGLRVDWAVEEGVAARADPELLRLVARNLLDNAVAHADVGGDVRVVARATGSDAVLEVDNSGCALPTGEIAARRFWRGDAARPDAGLHCGLGLALVSEAARILGARVELRSVGGRFRATVTLAAERAREPVPS